MNLNAANFSLKESPNYIIFANKDRQKEFEEHHPNYQVVKRTYDRTVYFNQDTQEFWLSIYARENARGRKYTTKLMIDSTIDKRLINECILPNARTKDIQYF